MRVADTGRTPEQELTRAAMRLANSVSLDASADGWALVKGIARLVAERDEARRENELVKASLAEPCAECGHIDWRSDGYLDPFIERSEAAEARVEVLREALAYVFMAVDTETLRAICDYREAIHPGGWVQKCIAEYLDVWR